MTRAPKTRHDLVAYLMPYISADDVSLTHQQFLRAVAGRIADDLDCRIQPNPDGAQRREDAPMRRQS